MPVDRGFAQPSGQLEVLYIIPPNQRYNCSLCIEDSHFKKHLLALPYFGPNICRSQTVPVTFLPR